jgi:hypothetical protein
MRKRERDASERERERETKKSALEEAETEKMNF